MTAFKVNFANVLDIHPRPISCMRLNEKTKQLALYRGGEFGSIELWNVAHQPYLVKRLLDLELIDGKPSVESIVWVQGKLFSGGLHGFVLHHDLQTGKIKSKAAATSGPVWCLSVKPDETQIAAGTEDGFINIFDVVGDNLIYLKVLDRQEGRVLCIDWSPCGNFIASGSVDSVRLWDVEKGHAIQRLITGRTKNKETIVWSIIMMEDQTIVTGDSRGIVSFWDGRVGVLKFKLITHKADILTLKLSQDKTQLYAAGVDPVVIIMNRIGITEKWVKSHPRNMHTNDVMTLETCGNRLFSGGMDADFVMSAFPPKVVTKFPPISCMPFVLQSENHLLVQKEAGVNIWRLPSPGNELQKILEFQTKGCDNVYSSALSLDGRVFAVSTLKYIRIYVLDGVKTDSHQPPKLLRLPLEDSHNVIRNTFWNLNFLNNNRLLGISADGRKAIFISLSEDSSSSKIEDFVSSPFEDEEVEVELNDGVDNFIVTKDGTHICLNCNNRLVVYLVDDEDSVFEKVCSVPVYYTGLTSMNFHPEKPFLLLTYADHCIQVYDFSSHKIIFQEKIKKKFDDLLPLVGSSWIENGNAAVVFQVDKIYLIKMVLNEEPVKKSRKGASASHDSRDRYDFFIKSCETQYKYLAFMGNFNDEQELLAVEVNPNSILEKLPPAFAKKRFGA